MVNIARVVTDGFKITLRKRNGLGYVLGCFRRQDSNLYAKIMLQVAVKPEILTVLSM